LFRFFDVLQALAVWQSQSLPGWLGRAIDDVLAAVYVNLAVLLVYAGMLLLRQPLRISAAGREPAGARVSPETVWVE